MNSSVILVILEEKICNIEKMLCFSICFLSIGLDQTITMEMQVCNYVLCPFLGLERQI